MEHFLIIQTAFIGDVILSTPVIEKLSAFYPDAKIDFLVRKGNEGLLENHPKLNKVLIWRKNKAKYRSLLQVSRLIRSREYDCVINVQRFFASGLITAFSGAKLKIGFAKNPLSFLYNRKIGHRLIGQHETSRNLSLVREITDDKYVRPKLYPSKENYESISQYQQDHYLCFAPTSVWATKQFPSLKWVELILSQDENWKIYLLGGPADASECQEIIEMCGRDRVENLAGKLSFLESAALMEKATMNYVNDSAPMHMASSVNAPTNAVFCSTIPSFGFGPLSINAKVIETEKELNCRPCGLHGKKSCPLGHFECAYTIQKDQFYRPNYPEIEEA
ncbi:MAG: glycosyltransferase family 9 protein [Flavobacteriales bacterium]|nr:glycosyltransferase family 9 protein [Flavobacteriales bacterium]